MNKTKIIFTVFIILLAGRLTYGQNNKQVILSEKVGVTIEKEERTNFQLLPRIKGFFEGSFYLDTAGRYFAIIQIETEDKSKKDTTIYFTEKEIIRLSEQIQFFDNIMSGEYSLGKALPLIKTKDNIVYIFFNENFEGISAYRKFPGLKQKPENKDIEVGFGFSMGNSNIDFSAVTDFVNAAENSLITEGFSIAKPDKTLSVSPVFIFNADINFYKGIGISTELGLRSMGDFSSFKYFSVCLKYGFGFKNMKWLKPYLGIGVIAYAYEISFHYNAYDNTQTRMLEEIRSDGGAKGATFNLGIEFSISKPEYLPRFTFNIFGKYNLMKEVSSIYTAEGNFNEGYKTTLKLSNNSFGAGFKIYF
jgi:hypothetical protein